MPAATRSYWALSRAPRYSILFALPLLLAYEALAAAVGEGGTGVRNGADVILKTVFIAAASISSVTFIAASFPITWTPESSTDGRSAVLPLRRPISTRSRRGRGPSIP